MLAEALRVTILFLMTNHIYKFDGSIRRQTKGGPIGLEITGDLAQILMIWYDEHLKTRLIREGQILLLYKRYVDDINMGIKNQWKHLGDREKCEMKAAEMVEAEGNSIHKSTEITVDAPYRHQDRKLPMLDIKAWTEERVNENGTTKTIILHEFYAKEVSAKSITHARSAMPAAMKRTVLTQELLRVMLRCSPLLEWEVTVEHLNTMMKRIQYSGYGQAYRAQILKSALSAYDTIKEKDKNG